MQLYPLLAVNKTASGAIGAHLIVKGTTTDGVVAQSSAAADKHVGVTGNVATADGERLDVYLAGVVPVLYGGNVAYGDPLTANAAGKAIVATAGSKVVGIAQEKGDDGTIGAVLIAPSSIPAA